MSAKSSAATNMAWNWVIHSIGKFKQVDSSTLTGLVKKAPGISDDLGKDSREVVSLQILENLFIHENEAVVDTDSSQNAKISFELSEHCEDVLDKILPETSEPMTELEKQKWHVRPFILHKRASLPESPLNKLKEALIEGDHPLLESLKERSSLGGKNVSEITTPEVDVTFNAQNTVVIDDLVSGNPANEVNTLQEIKNSTRGKEHEISIKPHENNTLQEIENSTKAKEHEISIEPPIIGLEENTLMDHIVSKNLQQQPPDDVPRERIDAMKNLEFSNEFIDLRNDTLPNVSNSAPSGEEKAPMENGNQVEISTDNEKSDDEMTDIAAKKSAFLSSQCTLSQDSMATTDSAEICVCMKCNKNGELLVCNSDACAIRVHESCLGSAATFDDNGNFFCPFCAYSHAISKYLEFKKKALLARKELQAFLSSPSVSSKMDKNELRPVATVGEKVKENGGEDQDTMSRGKEDCAPTDSPHQPVRQANVHKRQSNENENENPVLYASNHSKRSRTREPQYTSPKIILGRRKSIWWKKSEEDILKEGIRRFATANNTIPWKEILAFGHEVFDKSRTTIDLKDKWRNICKASKKQKV